MLVGQGLDEWMEGSKQHISPAAGACGDKGLMCTSIRRLLNH